MERKQILLGSAENAIAFVNTAERLRATMHFVSDGLDINAKSLLGVFCMNLAEPLTLQIESSPNNIKEATLAIRKYITE